MLFVYLFCLIVILLPLLFQRLAPLCACYIVSYIRVCFIFSLVLSSPTTAVPGYYVPAQVLEELSGAFDLLHHVRPNSLRQGVPASQISYINMGSPDLTAEGIFLCGSYEAYSNHHHALKVKLLIGRDRDYNMFRDLRGVRHPPVYIMG